MNSQIMSIQKKKRRQKNSTIINHNKRRNDMSLKTAGVLSIVTGVGILLFWIAFFTVGLAPDIPPACYFSYEYAFPLPRYHIVAGIDNWRHICLTTACNEDCTVAGLWRVYLLGLLDMAFNYQNGMYTITVMDGVLNAFINIWCVVFGLCAILTLQRE